MDSPADERHLLIVDDDVATRMTMAGLLEDVGYRVHEAGSLAEARRQLGQKSYRVIILDLHLGDGLGSDLIGEIRAALPEAVLVVMSGSAPSVHVTGADLLINKACDPAAMLDRLARADIDKDPRSPNRRSEP